MFCWYINLRKKNRQIEFSIGCGFHSFSIVKVVSSPNITLETACQDWFRFSFKFMVLNATFNNISVISWQSVLLVDETGENH
jgi:hypothetical protein